MNPWILLQKKYKTFQWLAFTRLLKKLQLNHQRIYFKSSASLAFPTREIQALSVAHDVEITANFLGLQGAATPLPIQFTEFIVQDDADDSNLNDFFNFFNQRFYEALIKIDEKYHYLAQSAASYADPLSRHLQSLSGMLPAQDPHQQALLLHLLSGLRCFMGGNVSKQGVCLFLQKLFNIERVNLIEHVKKAILIPQKEQNSLGCQSVLGETIMLGRYVYQASLHFEVHFYLHRIDDFLPMGRHFQLLQAIINYVLKAPLFVTLVLHAKQVNLPILEHKNALQLGYTSVLAQDAKHVYRVKLALL